MNKKKLRQESAFPLSIAGNNTEFKDIGEYSPSDTGMSKRLYIATKAMQGMISIPNLEITKERIVEKSYEIADELLSQENNEI